MKRNHQKAEPFFYFPPQRGSSDACRTCGIAEANQHTLGESAKCDGIRNGFLDRNGRPIVKQVAA